MFSIEKKNYFSSKTFNTSSYAENQTGTVIFYSILFEKLFCWVWSVLLTSWTQLLVLMLLGMYRRPLSDRIASFPKYFRIPFWSLRLDSMPNRKKSETLTTPFELGIFSTAFFWFSIHFNKLFSKYCWMILYRREGGAVAGQFDFSTWRRTSNTEGTNNAYLMI